MARFGKRTAAVALPALALGYAAAYLSMISPLYYWLMPYPNLNLPSKTIALPVEYRFGGRFSHLIFWPANALDRLVRPGVWTIRVPAPSSEVGSTGRPPVAATPGDEGNC